MMASVLQIRNLISGYGEGTVLSGVSLEVYPGEILGVIGRNGVGKTTLLRTIMGIVRAKSGKIILGTRNIVHVQTSERARAGIGYVPQGRGIFAQLTVDENLSIGEFVSGKKNRNIIYSYFPRLKERLRQRAGTMSGGEQQQLAIARVILANPGLILLDEPSEGIQPSIVRTISDVLMKISNELNIAMILVEQDISMIQKCAKRCLLMSKGKIIKNLNELDLRDDTVMRHFLSTN